MTSYWSIIAMTISEWLDEKEAEGIDVSKIALPGQSSGLATFTMQIICCKLKQLN
jgi:hypothetical protein